jgi:CubicO group peptidase (beta-lactamase class C family)
MLPLKFISHCKILLGALLFAFSISASAQDKKLARDIDSFLQSKFEKGNIPGFSVAIVHQDSVIFSKGYGKSGNDEPLTADTPLAIASLSKAFTAMAVMQLVEKGKINVDAPVTQYYPAFPLQNAGITVKQLLNQTSGLSDKIFPEMGFNVQPTNLDASLARLKGIELHEKPGTKFRYHNPNYQILARIVELVSGENFSDYLTKNIFLPLGMRDTRNVASTREFYTSKGGNIPAGYSFVFGIPKKMNELDWFVQGSAGVTSSANDMAKWLALWLKRDDLKGIKLLSPQNMQAMLTPPANTGSSYGMGWFVHKESNTASHNGILWTYQSEQMLFLSKGYGIVVLFNSGLSAFQDYSSVTRGISDIINGQQPETGFEAAIWLELLVAVFAILGFIMGIRRIKRHPVWEKKYNGRLTFKIVSILILRLIPVIILLSIPQIFVLISGRVLNWERIFWVMPGVVIWLGIVSVFNIIIGFLCLKSLKW